jgi:hypothetical protein
MYEGYVMVRGDNNLELLNSVSPTWEIIENIRFYLAHKNKRIISEKDIAKELGLNYNSLANLKSRNSRTILMYIVIFCVKNNLDIRNFVRNI